LHIIYCVVKNNFSKLGWLLYR